MKVMATFSFSAATGNAIVQSGRIKEIFGNLMADLKPESVYLYPVDGQRGGHLIVNLTDSSQIAGVAERLWVALKADVRLTPVMGPEDLEKGLSHMGEIVAKYT